MKHLFWSLMNTQYLTQQMEGSRYSVLWTDKSKLNVTIFKQSSWFISLNINLLSFKSPQHTVCTSVRTPTKLSVLVWPLPTLFSIAKFLQAKILSCSPLDFWCLAYKRYSVTTKMNERTIIHLACQLRDLSACEIWERC